MAVRLPDAEYLRKRPMWNRRLWLALGVIGLLAFYGVADAWRISNQQVTFSPRAFGIRSPGDSAGLGGSPAINISMRDSHVDVIMSAIVTPLKPRSDEYIEFIFPAELSYSNGQVHLGGVRSLAAIGSYYIDGTRPITRESYPSVEGWLHQLVFPNKIPFDGMGYYEFGGQGPDGRPVTLGSWPSWVDRDQRLVSLRVPVFLKGYTYPVTLILHYEMDYFFDGTNTSRSFETSFLVEDATRRTASKLEVGLSWESERYTLDSPSPEPRFIPQSSTTHILWSNDGIGLLNSRGVLINRRLAVVSQVPVSGAALLIGALLGVALDRLLVRKAHHKA